MNEGQKIVLLAETLRKSRKVNSFDTNTEQESERLANALIDIEKSLKTISEVMPKILSENIDEESIDDLLLDVGEELRHILYHIKDAKYYSYLV